MEVMQVLHMNKGDGETSYAKNSIVQSKIISRSKSIVADAVEKLLITAAGITESMGAADLGCSSGPNSLNVMSDFVRLVHSTCTDLDRPFPDELRISLNDLPTNDFNHIFSSLLSGFYERLTAEMGLGSRRCFISAVAGSFYDRLFPRRSLHFVYSSSSLHWLSQVPAGLTAAANKGKIYISKTSHKSAMDAYAAQFQKDLLAFLRWRSEELVPGGRMVLSFIGRGSMDPTTEESCYQWELLAHALREMAREGLVEEEKIDSFNAPYYAPCQEEIRNVIKEESSYDIDRLEAFHIDWDGGDVDAASDRDEGSHRVSESVMSGRRVARTIRAVVEPMLRSHFGEVLEMDDLFRRYEEIVGDYLSKCRGFYVNLIVSIVRNG